MKVVSALIGVLILASSCIPSEEHLSTVTPEGLTVIITYPSNTLTQVQSPTETKTPNINLASSETAYPTPEAGINMDKFSKFPESYEYLLNHLDEFVQAPDPLADRAAFDKWFNEELVLAVGEITHEREVDVVAGAYSIIGNEVQVGQYWDHSVQYLSLPQFFYFENQGVIYAVPVLNIQTLDYTPGKTNVTMAVILCDTKYWSATDGLSRLSIKDPFQFVSIFNVRMGDYTNINQFIDAGFIPVGDINDPKMLPLFGPGRIRFP